MVVHSRLDNVLWLIISVLATWRVTALLAYEAGPFDVFTHLRRVLVLLRLRALATCFHCLGVWIAAGVALFVYTPRPAMIVVILAVAGGASVLERWLGGGAPGAPTQEPSEEEPEEEVD